MRSIRICGGDLSRYQAQYFPEFSQSLCNNITFALECEDKHGLSSQKHTTWAVRTARSPDPTDKAIIMMKDKTATQHVSIFEEWKQMSFASAHWLWSQHGESLWTRVYYATNYPFSDVRNWFSHQNGKRNTTLGEEQKTWKKLLKKYKDLLPVASELIIKLEAALEDEEAWERDASADAQSVNKQQSHYTTDCLAVLEVIAAEHQKSRAQLGHGKFEKLVDSVRKMYELNVPWKYQPWYNRIHALTIQCGGPQADSDHEEDSDQETDMDHEEDKVEDDVGPNDDDLDL
jgi:hypothetical protein